MKLFSIIKRFIQAPIRAWRERKRQKKEAEKIFHWYNDLLTEINHRKIMIIEFEEYLYLLPSSTKENNESFNYCKFITIFLKEFYIDLYWTIAKDNNFNQMKSFYKKKKYEKVILAEKIFRENNNAFKKYFKKYFKNK